MAAKDYNTKVPENVRIENAEKLKNFNIELSQI